MFSLYKSFITHIEKFTGAVRSIGIALNAAYVDKAIAKDDINKLQTETNLPSTDVMKYATGKLLDAVIQSSNK